MLESYTNGAGAPAPRSSFPRLETLPGFDTPRPSPAPTAISAHVAENDNLLLNVAADDLLSRCWSKGCEFARNFGAAHISIEFLLLGAAHVRDAEPVLAGACYDVEALSHALATRCAKRSFSPAQANNQNYHADKTLKGLLCGTAALAASQEMPRLTLSLLLEAVALHHPALAVLDLLPTLQATHQQQTGPSSVLLLEQIADRLESIEGQIAGPQVEALEHALPFPQRDGLADAVAKLQRDVATLKGHLLYYPSGTANPFEPQPQPHLVIPSREEMVRVIAELPKRIASAVIEEIHERKTPTLSNSAADGRRPPWRWFRQK